MTRRNVYQPARKSHENFQKFDEMAKNHDEMVTGAVFGWKKRPQRGHGRRAKIALTEAPRRGGRRVAGLRFRSSLLYEGCSYILLG